jgi:hypothetical protein
MSKIYRTTGDWFILGAYWIGAIFFIVITGTIIANSINK